MELEQFIIDAFTAEPFKGNPAAVVPVEAWPQDALMQAIAFENNLSETAFIKPLPDGDFAIRWFSPLTEVTFCGHATLAASFVLFRFFGQQGEIGYHTRHIGPLRVTQANDGRIRMRFPALPPTPVEVIPEALIDGLSLPPVSVWQNQQAYVAVYENDADVRALQSDSSVLKTLAPYDIVVTAPGSDYDFVSRYFWPANGGDEDPVTGSIHACLVPFWAERLGKRELRAYQASSRGGVLYCELEDDAVTVAGDAVLYLRGRIAVPG